MLGSPGKLNAHAKRTLIERVVIEGISVAEAARMAFGPCASSRSTWGSSFWSLDRGVTRLDSRPARYGRGFGGGWDRNWCRHDFDAF